MRNLLIVLKLMGLMVIFAQAPDSTKTTTNLTSTRTPITVEEEIQKVYHDNAKQLEEIKAIKMENKVALQSIKKIDERKRSLKSEILKKVEAMTTRPPRKVIKPQVIYVKTEDRKNLNRIDIRNLKLDSNCVSYKRDGILDKKEMHRVGILHRCRR